MKLDAALPPLNLSAVPETARAAEALGFAALWTTETQHEAFLPHALIAEHTARMEMGTGIAVSFARSPMTMAHAAWDLAAQSQGRFILGLGTQVKAHIERRFGMPWPASVTGKLREQIEAMRAIWNSWQNYDRLNYRGEYYKLTLMSPFFNPGPLPPSPFGRGAGGEGLIPIYIAGVNTGLAKLAGEICNGFLVHPLNTPRYLREVLLPAIEEGAAKERRKREDVVISISAFAASTPEEKEFCRQQVSFYASTSSYRPVMELHGWGEIAERLSAHAARGEWGDMPALISDDILREFMTEADSPKELAAAIQERYRDLGERISLYIPFIPRQKDAWWGELIKAFGE